MDGCDEASSEIPNLESWISDITEFPKFELVESLGFDIKILPFSDNITKCTVISLIPRQFNGYDEAIIEFPIGEIIFLNRSQED